MTDTPANPVPPPTKFAWLNRTVLGVGLASLFSDWSHEMATTMLPPFLASLGVAAIWLGLIEGVADGLASLAKLSSGYYTDRLRRRQPVAVAGYLVTALGTASFALATSAGMVLFSRSLAWFGRGVRTPVRKALLAAAVTRETYGRAFGFERMMDTVGALAGPASALLLLAWFSQNYRHVFLASLVPGLLAAGVMAFCVQEQARKRVSHISFSEQLRTLPGSFRRFLVGVGLFGAGDFAPTLLILLAAQALTAAHGAATAASLAAGFYLLRNLTNTLGAPLAGWLADHQPKPRLLAIGYSLAALMALLIVVCPLNPWNLAIIFMLSGLYTALNDTLEDTLCAELVTDAQHGTAFGVLATVNGLGDFLSSIVVGGLWTLWGVKVAMIYSAVLFVLGAALVRRVRRVAS